MEKRLIPKKFVIPALYVILFTTIITGAFLITKSLKADEPVEEEHTDYVPETIVEEEQPVINEVKKMLKPYTNDKVEVAKSFYDYKADEKSQEKSITYYDGSYIQNSGIDYSLNETFDVVSVLDGTVTDVKDDEVLGKIVEIKHDNNFVSTYQSLSDVTVNKNDTVTAGQIIGKSGTNKIDKELGNHLHFELYTNGQVVDPNLYIDKEIKN